MAHSGKTITFAADLLPHETDTYNLGNTDFKWKIFGNLTGNAATATEISTSGGTTAYFWRGDNSWSNIIQQTANTVLGIDSNYNIGTTRKDLNFIIANGTGSNLNSGYAGGITWGDSDKVYAGIYYQTSSNYGSRLLLGTTNSQANGAYARMIIHHDGKIELPTNITSNSTTTGTLVVKGGVGIAGAIFAGGPATIAGIKIGTGTTNGPDRTISVTSKNLIINSPTDYGISFQQSSTKKIWLVGDTFYPETDKNGTLGKASYNWSQVYAKEYLVEEQVTLKWNSTDQSLDFIFA